MTRTTLRDFGFIHGLISDRIETCLSEVTDIEVQECTTEGELIAKIERVKMVLSEASTLVFPTVESLAYGRWRGYSRSLAECLSMLNTLKGIRHPSDGEEETVNTQILPSE